MTRIALLFLLAVGLVSCKNENPSKESGVGKEQPPPAMPMPSATPAETTPYPAAGATRMENDLCYLFASATDTIRLNIHLSGADAKGTLAYRLNGKDASTGELKGMVQGDVLYGQYTFMSEGKTSIREVAFKLTAADAREGYGELWEIGGRTIFKNRNGLKFENNMVLKAVACP